MGQVIHLDFTARRTSPSPTQASAPAAAPAAAPVQAPATTVPHAPVAIVDGSQIAVAAPASGTRSTARQPRAQTPAKVVDQPLIRARTGSEAPPAKSLTACCAEMRTHTDALAAAIADLKRASADLADLPRLARELCAAAL